MFNLLLSILLLASTALPLPVFGALTAFSGCCASRPEVATLLSIGNDGQKEPNIAYDAFNHTERRYDSHSMLLLADEWSAAGSRSAFFGFTEFLAAKAAGSGPAKGFLEVSDAFKSSKGVQNFGSAKPTDFIFDAQSQRFIMGNGGILGHDGALAAGRIAPSQTTVGGSIWRQNGRLLTDESSGHYGRNWTPELRRQFQNFMQQHGVDITHSPTYRK